VAETGPMLEVKGLDAYYGAAHILHGLDFAVGDESVAIVGRNGMGKTTLCAAIMGLMPSFQGSIRGSVRFLGKELVGQQPYRIAGLGIGYVPQGRRLFPSLTVDEHLHMLGPSENGAWSAERVYDLFPRLAERKRNGGAQLSGGEQQMLAIGRALLTNPRLLVMDEPSEGLAPAIIELLISTFQRLQADGLRIVLIEQNLGVATSLAKRQLIMVGGEIATETTADVLAGDREMQRRYLGVEALPN
jgi:branched-chain amino acid transport system ATP-binding protein